MPTGLNSQLLRIVLAEILAIVCLLSVFALVVLNREVPQLFEWVTVGTVTYLFGVVTNGSGVAGTKGPP